MTSRLEDEFATIIGATRAADADDVPVLLAIAHAMRNDPDLGWEASADALEGMAKRMTRRLQQADRLEARGLLEDTAALPISSLDEDP